MFKINIVMNKYGYLHQIYNLQILSLGNKMMNSKFRVNGRVHTRLHAFQFFKYTKPNNVTDDILFNKIHERNLTVNNLMNYHL